jgi:WD40 repeat protein
VLAVNSIKEPGVQLRDLKTGSVLQTLRHPTGVQAAAWPPDGHLLATGCDNHRIYLWDAASGKQQAVLEGHHWEVHSLSFDQDGGQLLSFGWDMTVRLWDVGARRQLLNLTDVRAVSFTRAQRLKVAVLAGNKVQLWECVPSAEYRVLHGSTNVVYPVDFSPDGRLLTSADYGGPSGCGTRPRAGNSPGFPTTPASRPSGILR